MPIASNEIGIDSRSRGKIAEPFRIVLRVLTHEAALSSAMTQNRFQRTRQFGTGAFQLSPVRQRQFTQDRAARRCQADPYFAPVFTCRNVSRPRPSSPAG